MIRVAFYWGLVTAARDIARRTRRRVVFAIENVSRGMSAGTDWCCDFLLYISIGAVSIVILSTLTCPSGAGLISIGRHFRDLL